MRKPPELPTLRVVDPERLPRTVARMFELCEGRYVVLSLKSGHDVEGLLYLSYSPWAALVLNNNTPSPSILFIDPAQIEAIEVGGVCLDD